MENKTLDENKTCDTKCQLFGAANCDLKKPVVENIAVIRSGK